MGNTKAKPGTTATEDELLLDELELDDELLLDELELEDELRLDELELDDELRLDELELKLDDERELLDDELELLEDATFAANPLLINAATSAAHCPVHLFAEGIYAAI